MIEQFVDYLWEQVKNHSIYVWGAQGQDKSTISESWIKSREDSLANYNRAVTFWKKQVAAGYGDVLRAFDCSGLGLYFLQNIHGILKSDTNAAGLRKLCTAIKKSECKAGDMCFRVNAAGNTTHVGYVVDSNGTVIEAMGRDVGVVARNVDAQSGYWTHFGRFPLWPEYAQKEQENPFVGICTGGSVNVRNKPVATAAKLGLAHKDDVLLVYDSGEAWPQVALVANGKIIAGYMSGKYIKKA